MVEIPGCAVELCTEMVNFTQCLRDCEEVKDGLDRLCPAARLPADTLRTKTILLPPRDAPRGTEMGISVSRAFPTAVLASGAHRTALLPRT